MQEFTLHPDDEDVLHTKYRSAVAWALWEELHRCGEKPTFHVVVPDPDLERIARNPEALDDDLAELLRNPSSPGVPETPARPNLAHARSVFVVCGSYGYDVRGRISRGLLGMYATELHNAPWDVVHPVIMATFEAPSERIRRELWTPRDDLALPLARLMADRLLDRENPWPAFR